MSAYPWRDKNRLYREYVMEEKSSVQLSREWDCSKTTVLDWLNRHGIETRRENKDKPVPVRTMKHGYEAWRHQHGNHNYKLYVHRLLAVSEHGVDSVSDGVVHHKNSIPWDNRSDNIQVFESQSEHSKHHEEMIERGYQEWKDEEILRELYTKKGLSSREVADELGCCKSTVLHWLGKHGIPKKPSNRDINSSSDD